MVQPLTFETIILHPLIGALSLSLRLACIIIPLLIVFELIRVLPVWRRWGVETGKGGRMDSMGISPHTLVPLVTGVFLGIVYGAGVIIKISREKALGTTDLWLPGLFLATCHAVVEDTLIFVVVGGMGRWIILPRILLATILTVTFVGWKWQKKTKQISS